MLFGISQSTAFKIIDTCIDFLVNSAHNFIKFPDSTAEKEALAVKFAKVFIV